MTSLPDNLRSQLETTITKAREIAERAAFAALERLSVERAEAFDHLSPEEKQLRVQLRAVGRQHGDIRKPSGVQAIDKLKGECAYEYWHRMLFARFLAENHLLMHPDGVSVSLAECDQLAAEEGTDGWTLASRYAAIMLPQIFRPDDPLLQVQFAPEHKHKLERLLGEIEPSVFLADDSLGWVYQFWQTNEKKRVNESDERIDADTLPAVTQLFTEPYMVKFLLHNTVGAWWCARHGVARPSSGVGVPAGKTPVAMEFLRWRDDGMPAGGSFDSWPESLKHFSMLDPCCGSGHFLVEAFNLLVPMRMLDEDLSVEEACDAVLSENLFGLELDPRCTQIAAFALALAAWRYQTKSGDAIGYRELPQLNIACSGQRLAGKKEEWLAIAGDDEKLKNGMENLYELFRQAPILGSLIDPRREVGDLIAAGFRDLQPQVFRAMREEKMQNDAEASAIGVAALGIATAAELLSRRYTLIATNVPYLGRGDQPESLKRFADTFHPKSKTDLATMFIERCGTLTASECSTALVVPRIWLSYTAYYEDLRRHLLQKYRWDALGILGKRAFEGISGEIVNVVLLVLTSLKPADSEFISVVDASSGRTAIDKAMKLLEEDVQLLNQEEQSRNPGAAILLHDSGKVHLLSEYACVFEGLSRGDAEQFDRHFWELYPVDMERWALLVNSTTSQHIFDGRDTVFLWEKGRGALASHISARVQGDRAWGKQCVFVSRTHLNCLVTLGHIHAQNGVAVIPNEKEHLLPILTFCSSEYYKEQIELLNQKLIKPTGVMDKVPFDLEHWTAVAKERYPEGLPQPSSSSLSQWYFHGNLVDCERPLHVAIASLLGFRWPTQSDVNDELTDHDGIVCIPAVRAEKPAAERLLEILRAAYGSKWSESVRSQVFAKEGFSSKSTLDDWLRNKFIEQHYRIFSNRPFIWQIWDGRRDGFSCLVNYHMLDHKNLQTLVFAYLRDWIKKQSHDAKGGDGVAEDRLVAAQDLQKKLELILAGESPYDIFVRWKPLAEQPIGWHPDLDDGVRANIRPFVEAGVLRKNPNLKWSKDRGTEPEHDQISEYPWFWEGSDFKGVRVNDVHLSLAEKRAARGN